MASTMKLLNEKEIRQALSASGFIKPVDIHLFSSIDSTNRLLKELPRSESINLCCAEMQTAGRGRFGRPWYSPFGDNIYFSSRWHFDCDLSCLSGLSLVVSLAIMRTLDNFGLKDGISVKWPNDIFFGHKKLCGSLIEVIAESNSGAEVVIGIGLNVNSDTLNIDSKGHPDKPWCSLYDIIGVQTDRNLLIASLIITLNEALEKFMLKGFKAFITEWNQVDYLKNNWITVSQPTGSLQGNANGVNEYGQLILVDEAGATHYLSSGDTSLHLH